MRPLLFSIIVLSATIHDLLAWQEDRPTLKAGIIQEGVVIDGLLDEADWTRAPSTDNLVTIEPVQGGQPSGITEVKVLASKKN